jgi:hypothetical protein
LQDDRRAARGSRRLQHACSGARSEISLGP